MAQEVEAGDNADAESALHDKHAVDASSAVIDGFDLSEEIERIAAEAG